MTSSFKKSIITILILLALGSGFFWLAKKYNFFRTEGEGLLVSSSPGVSVSYSPSATPAKTSLPSIKPSISSTPRPSLIPTPAPQSILLDVPFFAQAPFGEWSDPLFQNACEEASIIMAWHWANNTPVTKDQAKQEILALTQFEDQTYGAATDRSAADTAKMFKDYYGYQNITERSGISTGDIKQEILKGHLVITPVNGRILKNPFYTPPGPDHHMLVIIGYDGATDEFITNDVGTRHGEKYRYAASRFEAALQDYPTGNDLPSIPGETAMIVVLPK